VSADSEKCYACGEEI